MKKLFACAAAIACLGMHLQALPPNRTLGAAQTSSKARLKIMPLGDSITWGARDPSYGGYRHLLGRLLTDDGYNFAFVGSQHNGKNVIPDPDNEGHPGWRIPQAKEAIDANGWLETYKPDIILLHIGTNDIHEGDAAAAPGNLSALLDDILARLPQTHVIVAQIIPFRRGPDPAHQSYNGAISGIAASKGSRVSVVDMQNILTRNDYVDGMHPNASGYDKMAHAWERAIRESFPVSPTK
jgi:lysophospholipase L1-like esterase